MELNVHQRNVSVSIIVPIYNVAQYLEACLNSIRQQSYRDLEVVFVDDGSSDDSIVVLQHYLHENDFPKYKITSHNVNRGLSAARNTGLALASGDYVLFLDSDDELSSDCIDILVGPLVEKAYDIVVGDWQSTTGVKAFTESLEYGCVDNALSSFARGGWYVMAWNKLYRRSFLRNTGLLFKENLVHEDVLWSFCLACECSSMYIVNQVTYYYRVRANSIMSSMTIENDVSIYVRVFDEVNNYIRANGLETNKDVYCFVEGKKSAILYSLLQVGQFELYRKCYKEFFRQNYLRVFEAYRKHVVGLVYFFRDLHYSLPPNVGCWYKCLFYMTVYKLRGKKIVGSLWD